MTDEVVTIRRAPFKGAVLRRMAIVNHADEGMVVRGTCKLSKEALTWRGYELCCLDSASEY